MAINPVENIRTSLPRLETGNPPSKIVLAALGILLAAAAAGFLAAGMYLAGASFAVAGIAVLAAFLSCKKQMETEPSIQDPVSQAIRKFHNPKVADAIVGIYITANETNLENSVKALQDKPLISNSCHIGFSGWHNFDIMAIRQSKYGLICDFNPHNKKFIERTMAVLRIAATREEFAAKMVSVMDEIDICPKHDPSLKTAGLEIEGELHRKGSWLSTDEGFQHIKKLAEADRVAAITEDICNTGVFQTIFNEYAERGIEIDTLYLSNISLFMGKAEKKAAFRETIKSLIEPNTCVIHCPLKEKYQDGVRVKRLILDQDAVLGSGLTDDRLFVIPLV